MKKLPKLNLPDASLRLCREDGIVKVFDPIRKIRVAFTPEEYVRQSFTAWLISSLGYPPPLMANEIGLNLNGTKKRCDTVVFNIDGSPLMIVEYKAPEINITQNVFDQIARYNMVLNAGFLTVSNGLAHYCCRLDYRNSSYSFLREIPKYADALNWK